MKKVLFQIFTDFDSTITPFDFCTKIPLLKSYSQTELEKWNTVSKLFGVHYQKSTERLFSQLPVACTNENICSILKPMDDSEEYGVSLLQEYQILNGLTRQQLCQFALSNIQQSNELEFIRSVFSNPNILHQTVYIMTTNWSQDVVSTSMEYIMQPNKQNKEESSIQTQFEQFGNQMLFNNNDVCVGFTPHCTTSKSKLEFFKAHANKNMIENRITIYIGDSIVDVPTLLHADLGLLFKPGHTVRKLCNVLRIPILSVDEYTKRTSNVLYEVDNWKQIQKVLERFQ